MIKIKKATELTNRQWYLFFKFVANYYKKNVIESNKNPVANKMKMTLLYQGYAERTLARIKNGNLEAFVQLSYDPVENGDVPTGFITAYIEEENELLRITNLFITDTHPFKALGIKALFEPMATYAKEHGITRTFTTSDLLMPELSDSLEILGFDQGTLHGTEIPYGLGFEPEELAGIEVVDGKRITFKRNFSSR